MDDKTLIRKLKKGDEQALKELIIRFTPLISSIISNISCGSLSRADIEEVTSDVFVTLWKNSDKIIEKSLKNYICCIVKSRTKDRLRKKNIDLMMNIDDIEDENLPDSIFVEEETENKELCSCLRKEIMKIGQPDREILIRYYYYYQTTSAIAEALEMNIDTVKSKLRRTRIKLKNALRDRGY